MAKTKYEFRKSARVSGDPQVIGETLETLRKEKGHLTTEQVLSSASDPSSPIHGNFNWDDASAAVQHRQWEARQLIKSVVIVTGERKFPAPAFVHVTVAPNVPERHYQSTIVAVKDRDIWEEVMKEVLADLAKTEKRLRDLQQVEKDNARRQTSRGLAKDIEKAREKAEKKLE